MALRKAQYADMDKYKKTINAQRKRYYKKTQGYKRREWTLQEIDMIMTSTMTDVEMSGKIKRSVMAIQIKRARLKKQSKGEDGVLLKN